MFFFGCTQDDCECELPEEDNFYLKFEVNGTPLLYEDEFNVVYYMWDFESGIYSLNCKAFLDAELSINSRMSISLYNDDLLQTRQEYDLQNGFRFNDTPELHPRVSIKYIDSKGELWTATQALVQIERLDFEDGFVKCFFNATLVSDERSSQTINIQNGEFRLPVVFAL